MRKQTPTSGHKQHIHFACIQFASVLLYVLPSESHPMRANVSARTNMTWNFSTSFVHEEPAIEQLSKRA